MPDQYQLPLGILLTVGIVALVFTLGDAAVEKNAIAEAEELANPTPPRMCDNGLEYKRPYGCNERPLTSSELVDRLSELEQKIEQHRHLVNPQ